MKSYLYALIRYIADSKRMEPRNIGVVVIAEGKVVEKMDRHLAKRRDVDTEEYRAWQVLIRRELEAPDAPLFRPAKTSPRFLAYLDSLQEGRYRISPPFIGEAAFTTPEGLVDRLYSELVAPPPEEPTEDATKPAGRYRQLEEQHRFKSRGLRTDSYLRHNSAALFITHRIFQNGAIHAIDKVEVGRQLGHTSHDIERLLLVRERIATIQSDLGRAVNYTLLVDPFDERFTSQTEGEYVTMRTQLDEFTRDIERLGAHICRDTGQVEEFVDRLDHLLPQLGTA